MPEAIQEVFAPGRWQCLNCGFRLTKNLLHVATGNIAVDRSAIDEPCPNGCEGELQPVTWREEAISAEAIVMDLIKQVRHLENKMGLSLVS